MFGDMVILIVEIFEDMFWGLYSFMVNGVSGDIEKFKLVNFYVYF